MLKVIHPSQIIVENRSRKELGDLEEMKTSLASSKGIIQPLAVEAFGDKYRLLCGGRRYAAIKELGLEEVPVRIYAEGTLDDIQRKEIEEEENIRRKDFAWQEQVAIKKEIHELRVKKHGAANPGANNGWRIEDTANMFSESKANVSRDLALAEAISKAPELAKCKTKADATRLLASVGRHIKRESHAETSLAKFRAMPKDAIQRQLMERYILGDFFEKCKGLESESFDFMEIDPPYAIKLKEIKESLSKNNHNLHAVNYNEIPADKYTGFLTDLFKECFRLLKKDKWLVCWFSPDPWFQVVVEALREAGFTVRAHPALWVKPNGQTANPMKHLASCYEMFFIAQKGDAKIENPGRSNIFNFKPVNPDIKIHPTERPIPLIQEILKTFAPVGGTVLSPFLGSGNTILAAQYMGMNCIGFDLSTDFRNSFIARLSDDNFLYGDII
jgi:adenine-specific DNA-methyltransferase